MIQRGELYRAVLDPVIGSEQGGTRPVLIVQNDLGNRYSPTVVALAVTSRINKPHLPTHVALPGEKAGLPLDSVILAEQIRTLDKTRLREKMGKVPEPLMRQVDEALRLSLGISF